MEPPIVKGRVEAPVSEPITESAKTEHVVSETTYKSSHDELFATYELDHNVPFLADLFGIESLWNDPGLTYKGEIEALNDYFMTEIKNKTLDNSTGAIKSRLAALERQAGISKTSPVELKVKLLAEHASYLNKLENIKLGVRFNGNT